MIALACLDLLVGRADDRLGLGVELLDPRAWCGTSGRSPSSCLALLVVRPLVRDGGEEQVREPLGRVVRDLLPLQAAHVAGRAGRHGHVAGRQLFGPGRRGSGGPAGRRTARRASTRCRSRAASGPAPCGTGRTSRAPRELDRRGVPGVAGGAGADGAVRVRLADAVALVAALADRRRPLAARRAACGGRSTAPWWNFSAKATCSAVKSPLPVDRRPRRRRVPAAQELLVLGRVALLQLAAVTVFAIVKPRWSSASCPSAGWWQSRQLTPGGVWRLLSNSSLRSRAPPRRPPIHRASAVPPPSP